MFLSGESVSYTCLQNISVFYVRYYLWEVVHVYTFAGKDKLCFLFLFLKKLTVTVIEKRSEYFYMVLKAQAVYKYFFINETLLNLH